jgi:hypothetical protein
MGSLISSSNGQAHNLETCRKFGLFVQGRQVLDNRHRFERVTLPVKLVQETSEVSLRQTASSLSEKAVFSDFGSFLEGFHGQISLIYLTRIQIAFFIHEGPRRNTKIKEEISVPLVFFVDS